MHTEPRWTVEQLVKLTQAHLPPHRDGSRRVRWNPNPRLIRYYTSLGLLDRPYGVRGHVVFYGPRHLLQLLAIKALQAEGLALAAIQSRLTGQPDATLRQLAHLPDDPPAEPDRAVRQNFWEIPPRNDTVKPPSQPWQGYPLAPGVLLLIDPHEHPHVDAGWLAAAATELLTALRNKQEEPR